MKCKCGEHELVKAKGRGNWRKHVEYPEPSKPLVHTKDLCRTFDWS
jgi:hypothetical protein